MKEIRLTNYDLPAIIDDEDYELVMSHSSNWHVQKFRGTIAVVRCWSLILKKPLHLGRLINNTPDNKECDHINHNPLDNRRRNLRQCFTSQNCFNRILGKSPNAVSKFMGVSYDKRVSKYRAYVSRNRKQISLGYHETDVEAALAYDDYVLHNFGSFAKTNFPSVVMA